MMSHPSQQHKSILKTQNFGGINGGIKFQDDNPDLPTNAFTLL